MEGGRDGLGLIRNQGRGTNDQKSLNEMAKSAQDPVAPIENNGRWVGPRACYKTGFSLVISDGCRVA